MPYTIAAHKSFQKTVEEMYCFISTLAFWECPSNFMNLIEAVTCLDTEVDVELMVVITSVMSKQTPLAMSVSEKVEER